MSELEVFMKTQMECNAANARTMEALSSTVADLEKTTVMIDRDRAQAIKNESRTELLEVDMAEIKHQIEFVKESKAIFKVMLVAILLAIGGTIWGIVVQNQVISSQDISKLIEAIEKRR